ncbi:hypothetical protein L3X38_010877 [Prunus dulcis]|uniref:Uncharacterized protein n=1 Tax=Prunus dulcis TaxID=3755 RepID=A0AAD4WH21_PRUDU|nr:hypothetical protein L3X38_010877 [Prunus dulcis]
MFLCSWFRPEQQINDEQLAYFSIHDRSFLSRRFQVLGVEEISCKMLLDLQKSFDLDTKSRENIDNHNLIERSCLANP